jgi:putative membrane protein insertion efficiency factor
MTAVRRASWLIGTPFRIAVLAVIRLYRSTLSGWLGGQCRYYPTCSHYADDVIRARGVLVGSALAGWRILRCNPFGTGGLDPAPQPRSYDDVISRGDATRT